MFGIHKMTEPKILGCFWLDHHQLENSNATPTSKRYYVPKYSKMIFPKHLSDSWWCLLGFYFLSNHFSLHKFLAPVAFSGLFQATNSHWSGPEWPPFCHMKLLMARSASTRVQSNHSWHQWSVTLLNRTVKPKTQKIQVGTERSLWWMIAANWITAALYCTYYSSMRIDSRIDTSWWMSTLLWSPTAYEIIVPTWNLSQNNRIRVTGSFRTDLGFCRSPTHLNRVQ